MAQSREAVYNAYRRKDKYFKVGDRVTVAHPNMYDKSIERRLIAWGRAASEKAIIHKTFGQKE